MLFYALPTVHVSPPQHHDHCPSPTLHYTTMRPIFSSRRFGFIRSVEEICPRYMILDVTTPTIDPESSPPGFAGVWLTGSPFSS
jgi:hypothetical protein